MIVLLLQTHRRYFCLGPVGKKEEMETGSVTQLSEQYYCFKLLKLEPRLNLWAWNYTKKIDQAL